MSEQLEERVKYLDELLKEFVQPSENEFVAIAIAGERLRRALPLEEVRKQSDKRVARQYLEMTAKWADRAPTEFADLLGAALEELAKEAAKPIHERNEELLEDAVWGVDEVLCVAVAAHRIGALQEGALAELAGRASKWGDDRAADFPCLWGIANELEMQLGPDPDASMSYRWTDPLAALSEERLSIAESLGLFDGEVRRRVTSEVLKRLGVTDDVSQENRPTGTVISLKDWARLLPDPLADKVGGLLAMPQLQAAADGQDGLERRLIGLVHGGEVTLAIGVVSALVEWDGDGEPPQRVRVSGVELERAPKESTPVPAAWLLAGLQMVEPVAFEFECEGDWVTMEWATE